MSRLSMHPIGSNMAYIKTEDDSMPKNCRASYEESSFSTTVVEVKNEVAEEKGEPNDTDRKAVGVKAEADFRPENEEQDRVNISCSVEKVVMIKKEKAVKDKAESLQSNAAVSSKNNYSNRRNTLQPRVLRKGVNGNCKNESNHVSSSGSGIASVTSSISLATETVILCNSKSSLSACPNAQTISCTGCSAKDSNERPFSCTHCAASKEILKTRASRMFSCAQCTASFSARSALRKHAIIHSNERPFSCRHCSATFKTKGILKAHLAVHSRKKPFTCAHCAANFKTKGNLKGHLLTVHSTEKPVACLHRHCAATFKTKSHLRNHLHVHAERRPFSCAECGAAFKTKSDLKRHLVVHSSEKPFVCLYCAASFKTRNLLRQHLVVHLSKDSSRKPFACKCCAAVFETEELLKTHVSQHASMLQIHCFQRLCSSGSCGCVCILCVGDT